MTNLVLLFFIPVTYCGIEYTFEIKITKHPDYLSDFILEMSNKPIQKQPKNNIDVSLIDGLEFHL